MTLPDLSLQVLYGGVAWALVLAAVAVALLPAAWRRTRGAVGAVLAIFLLWHALPGAATPSYWLGLAFQMPSALLASLCALRLFARWQGRKLAPALPLALAAPLALLGVVLYVDAMGLLALGWYYAGFGPVGAPLAGLALAASCAWAVVRGVQRPYAVALLAALCLFALLRLPTGNLWDALLDPFLVVWSIVSVVHAWRRRDRRAVRIA